MGDINTNIRIDDVIEKIEEIKTSLNTKVNVSKVRNEISNRIPTFIFSKRLESFPYTMTNTELYEFTYCTERLYLDDYMPNFKISVDGFGNYYINGAIYYEKTENNNSVVVIEFMKKDLSRFYVQVNQTTGYTELVTP